MARLTEYDERQAAGRLRVAITAFRWAVHAGIAPRPDGSGRTWSRAAVEAMDRDAITAALPGDPLSGRQAADRIAEALGTPNVPGEPTIVTAFVVRRFMAAGLLTELSGNPDGSLVHPSQVDEVCTRADLAELVAADSPLGPDQAAARLGGRRIIKKHMVRLGWITPAEWREVQFGTSRAGAVDVPLYRAAEVEALPAAHPEVDWPALRAVGKGRRSPLAAVAK